MTSAQASTRITPSPINSVLAIGAPLFVMMALAVFEPSQIDLWITDHLYIAGKGFIGGKSFFLEDILHDFAKQVVIALAVFILATLIISYIKPVAKFIPFAIDQKRLLYIVIAMTITTSLITPLKELTEVQCPWSLDRYGGVEHYSSLMSTRAAPVHKAGSCWPGGHASSGFCLFALFFAMRDIRPRAARIALVIAVTLGITFSVGRMLQGAHFLSHNLWTALIDWTVSASLYRFMFVKT
jgi:membrane-associated PAP2 superfamily phosphatase